MIFSSLLFLYLFLPLTLLGYYLIQKEYRNTFLLLASLVFFAWGGASFTLILIFSIVLNYLFGLKIQKHLNTPAAYKWLALGVSSNILILGVFKYANFIIFSTNRVLGHFQLPNIPESHIVLPIGISFYTFHSLSYLVDIYRKKTTAQRNILDLSLYITMFSQLIAGPIIRYSDVWQQLRGRTHSTAKFSQGVERFIIGLGKKVLIANTFAIVADRVFACDFATLTAANAWLGIICYTFQIYFDFSGYSDMAIGLGKMFGFDFLENFNLPYSATSVKEFWRRWHISLSSFFRDYVYIPLGGNRVKVSRMYINLLIVFFLTGFWHGANWSFIAWGLFHGFFLVIERIGLGTLLEKLWKPIALIYTFIVVMFAWVLFRTESISNTFEYWRALFRFSMPNDQTSIFMNFLTAEFFFYGIIGLVGAFGLFSFLQNKIAPYTHREQSSTRLYIYHSCSSIFYAVVLFICSLYLMAGTYNPFIYFRF